MSNIKTFYDERNNNFFTLINNNDYTEEEIKNAFAQSLKEVRSYSGLSLKAVSEKTGIPLATISAYENGTRIPSFILAMKITAFFGATIEDFVYNGLNETIENYPDILTLYDFSRGKL